MITRMFEYVGGGSDKFWEVTYPAAHETAIHFWTCRWGRRHGGRGQSKTFPVGHWATASRDAQAKIEEKLAKGYVEVAGLRVMRVESAVSTVGAMRFRPVVEAATSTRTRPEPKPKAKPAPQTFERPKRRIRLG